MPRNIVVCCDGTNNQFGPENTSVVRLVQVLERNPAKQLLYYDPGVGTLPEPGVLTRVGKTLSRWLDLAFGTGLTGKVEDAYVHLMDFWEPGDQVFPFGFSRGAYTARVLAGLLHTMGLLPRGNHQLVPYVMRLFSSIRTWSAGAGGPGAGKKAYWKLCDDFRWTFARPTHDGDNDRRFRVHFLGVWDTVSSVGWVWEPAKFPFTAHNPSIDVIRHAVAMDERRWFFRQNLMEQTARQDFQQLWFPGVHADVGGGYPEKDGGLWRVPFEWLLHEARTAGLHVNPHRLDEVLYRTQPPARPWDEPQHESLRGLWWLAEFFPKLKRAACCGLMVPRFGLGRHRHIPIGALLDRSSLLRMRETGYSPPNLAASFSKSVRALADVPEHLPYTG